MQRITPLHQFNTYPRLRHTPYSYSFTTHVPFTDFLLLFPHHHQSPQCSVSTSPIASPYHSHRITQQKWLNKSQSKSNGLSSSLLQRRNSSSTLICSLTAQSPPPISQLCLLRKQLVTRLTRMSMRMFLMFSSDFFYLPCLCAQSTPRCLFLHSPPHTRTTTHLSTPHTFPNHIYTHTAPLFFPHKLPPPAPSPTWNGLKPTMSLQPPHLLSRYISTSQTPCHPRFYGPNVCFNEILFFTTKNAP